MIVRSNVKECIADTWVNNKRPVFSTLEYMLCMFPYHRSEQECSPKNKHRILSSRTLRIRSYDLDKSTKAAQKIFRLCLRVLLRQLTKRFQGTTLTTSKYKNRWSQRADESIIEKR